MAAAWPGTLPNYFTVDGFARHGPTNVVRNQTISGRFKAYRISTKTHRVVEGTLMLTLAELATFETFYRDTLNDGTLAFQDLTNPLTGTNQVWQFLEDPLQQPFQGSGTHFALSLRLLALPDTPT